MKLNFFSISDIVIIIIMLIQVLFMFLPWFGIHPPQKPTNIFEKLFSILFFKIPVIWVIFTACLSFIFISSFRRRKKTSKDQSPRLLREHYWALLYLLDQTHRAYSRRELEETYKVEFNKGTADFNILESELQKWDLIYVRIRSGRYDKYWGLTDKGLEVSSKAHKTISKGQ